MMVNLNHERLLDLLRVLPSLLAIKQPRRTSPWNLPCIA